MEEYKEYLDADTIIVAHSLSVPFALNVIEQYPIGTAFFVAGFIGKTGNKYDDGMKTFAQREFDWKKIRSNCHKFRVIYSDNDPYIRTEKSIELANNLETDPTLVKAAGHFNSGDGYTSFELLLTKIKEIL
ncbi:alpha/beta hydrolase [Patescibacteria group bacterium]|nr:alpha/beta hydrolase [Patescibacteria group bacterium]